MIFLNIFVPEIGQKKTLQDVFWFRLMPNTLPHSSEIRELCMMKRPSKIFFFRLSFHATLSFFFPVLDGLIIRREIIKYLSLKHEIGKKIPIYLGFLILIACV